MAEIKETIIENNPYIKISKNSRGYNYEFKINSLDIEAAVKIDNQLKEKFGHEQINTADI